MKLPRLVGWKLWTWAAASLAWSAFYMFFALLAAGMSVGAANEGLMFLFNWLFPVALLYLLFAFGKRR